MKVSIKLRKENPIWNQYLDQLQAVAETRIVLNGQLPEICDDDILITTNLTSEELRRYVNLKAIFLPKTGIDKLPVSELKEKKISIWNSHANADIIAEHALALSLALLHRIPEFSADLKNNIWYSDGKNYYWQSIKDLTIGILGYGHVGKELYQLLQPMNNNIYVLNQHKDYPLGINGVNSLEELIEKCNLLYVCLPLNDTTRQMFDDKNLHLLKDKFIVNIARAEIFDEKPLYELLQEGVIAGYASDVWFHEANKNDRKQKIAPSNYPFSDLKNVVISPHCATHTCNAQSRYIADCINACISFIKADP